MALIRVPHWIMFSILVGAIARLHLGAPESGLGKT